MSGVTPIGLRLADHHRPDLRGILPLCRMARLTHRAGLTRTYWPTTTSLICITGVRSV
jgi:hypothetical protein